MSNPQIIIVPSTPKDDLIIAQHFYQLWLDNDVSADLIYDDWLNITLQFILNARRELEFQAFIAQVENQIVGSVSCQLFTGLYPAILQQKQRQYGYIWNVYVESNYRRQGIATKLTAAAIAHLQSLNCTKAVLNASASGKSVFDILPPINRGIPKTHDLSFCFFLVQRIYPHVRVFRNCPLERRAFGSSRA
ncbi:MAG: GNAT family N-acetyltransferase [Cyanobacteria bacterium J06621_12]